MSADAATPDEPDADRAGIEECNPQEMVAINA